jgi:hypothetical protein
MLSNEELRRYQRDGVLFPVEVLTPPEVAAFRAEAEALLRRMASSCGVAVTGQGHLHFRWAYELVTHPRILDTVAGIIGDDLLVHSATIFGKTARGGQYVSWHQDGWYLDLDEPALVTAWVALSESDAGNGCVQALPGSHARGRLPHASTAISGGNLLLSGLEVAVPIDENAAVDIELAPGQMSLHHVDTVHASRPNESDRSRLGVAVRYVPPRVRQRSPHHAVLLARGTDRYGHFQVQPPPREQPFDVALAEHLRFVEELKRARRAEGRATG